MSKLYNTHIPLVFSIDAGSFLCDGGAIFGTTPKTVWSSEIASDQKNRIKLAMRCLLVVLGDRKILIETGAGNKYTSDFIDENGMEGLDHLLASLHAKGFSPGDITDVVLTHLHWDHCGGGVINGQANQLKLTFPNATYHCSLVQWKNAMSPIPPEEDSFIKSDLLTMKESDRLNFIDNEGELFPGLQIKIMNGHTKGMLVPEISLPERSLIYLSDLAPMLSFIPLLRVSAYDLDPRLAVQEKTKVFAEAIEKQTLLFFVHDFENECCTLKWDEHHHSVIDQKGRLADLT
jgi:glyoxylase-like metal-dependent hydrolase (beta-lactamase superfamily II)